MFSRLRLSPSIVLLGVVLALSLAGVVSSSASIQTKGRVVSASLTKTSFPAAQAKTVKLKCRFSPATRRAVFLLQMKKGAKWTKLRSVTKKGSIEAYTTTVKKLFGAKAVKVGQYRVKISADANSLTRAFTVKSSATRCTADAPGEFGKLSPGGPEGPGEYTPYWDTWLEWSPSENADYYQTCVDSTNDRICSDYGFTGTWVSSDSTRRQLINLETKLYYWQARAVNETTDDETGETLCKSYTYADGGSWFVFGVTN